MMDLTTAIEVVVKYTDKGQQLQIVHGKVAFAGPGKYAFAACAEDAPKLVCEPGQIVSVVVVEHTGVSRFDTKVLATRPGGLVFGVPAKVEDFADRRQAYRLNIELPVSVAIKGESTSLACTTCDLSASGMRFVAPTKINESSIVRCSFSLDGPIALEAQVMRVLQLDSGQSEHGVKFVKLPNKDEARVIRFINNEQTTRAGKKR